MPYVLKYTLDARNDLARLGSKTARRITDKLAWYAASPDPMRFAKRLTGDLHGAYRFRIGSYRALFEVTGLGIITILEFFHIDHRKDAY